MLGDSGQTGETARAEAKSRGPRPRTPERGDGRIGLNLALLRLHGHAEGKTLELFGPDRDPVDTPEPFHLYSMRQAIEEGFILDVLANYATYNDLLAARRRSPTTPRSTRAKAARRSPGS